MLIKNKMVKITINLYLDPFKDEEILSGVIHEF